MSFSLPVLLFARYADELGPSVHVTLTEPATARDVLAAVRALPGADRLAPEPMVAINQRYATARDAVRPGDEVAIVPPVAGG